ncbi:MAG: ABC-type polysaccharide/polyol phosphate transport system ATPase subunit [Cellvibrionaceae bacterium]|jgi:ABC-type polysaccharide/polyol phosphate transport system ATPase subunit
MSDTAIRFTNITKKFKLDSHKSIPFLQRIGSIFGMSGKSDDDSENYFYAIKNISFDIKKGETVGFVGTNGSGKSTLLKLAAKIINPTEGEIEVNGRLSALLELGAGLHFDLTGRENIKLGGALLGLSGADIIRIIDDIISFSELGDFIEIPVKHYSSGMFMRLAFSIAIYVMPEILFIDEILAVGDQSFQDKCFQRLHDLKRSHVTMIIVSHDLRSLQNICDRLIWIHHGELKMTGEPRQVLSAYTDFMRQQAAGKMLKQTVDNVGQRWGSGEIRFRSVQLVDVDGNPANIFRANEPLSVCMEWEAKEPIENPQFGLSIYRSGDGVQLNSPTSYGAGLDFGILEKWGEINYHIDAIPLLPGIYHFNVSIHDKQGVHTFDFIDRCQTFEITYVDAGENYGFLALPAQWEFKQNG